MDYKITAFKKFTDHRGDLIVFLKESELDDARKKFGQIYFVTLKKKGIVRGNHYHKKWHEWFGIVSGTVKVLLVDVKTGKKKAFKLSATSRKYVRLEIGPYIAHAFTCMTDYAAIVNYADSEWDKEDSINYKIV